MLETPESTVLDRRGVLAEHDLHEREEELSLLCELFHDAMKGRGRMAVVTGASGHGKSALLSAFAEYTSLFGAVHLSATASRAVQSVPFGVLGQFFRSADLPAELRSRVADLSAQALPEAGDAAVGGAAPEAIPPLTFHRMGLAVDDLVEYVGGPLLLSVEDLQYADAASLQCLSAAVRRLHTARLLVVLNECPQPWPSGAMLEAELPREPLTRRIRLRPLSRHGVAALLDEHLGRTAPSAMSADCLRITGGNPLLVRRLIEDTLGQEPGAAPRTLHVGPQFEQAVLDCLYRCHPSVRVAAREAAVLDDPFAPMLIRLSELDPRSLTLALRNLTETGLLHHDGRWRHPRARAAVLQGMTAEDRAALHTRAGTVLFKNGAPAIAVAHQLIAASNIDNDCAATVLLEAADESLHSGDITLALNCLALAHQYERSEEHHAATTAMLFRAEWRADPRAAARRVPALLDLAGTGLLSGRDVTAPLESLMWFGQPQVALSTLDMLESQAHRAYDSQAVVLLRFFRAMLAPLYPELGDLGAEADEGDGLVAPRAGAREQDGGAVHVVPACCGEVVAAVVSVLRRGPNPQSVHLAEQVLGSCRLDDSSFPMLSAAVVVLMLNGASDAAERWLAALAGSARKQAAPTWQALFEALAARLALQRGDARGAAERAQSALAAMPGTSWGVLIGLPLSVLMEAEALLGRPCGDPAHLRTTPPAPMFQTPLGLRFLYARGRLLLAQGRPAAALDDLVAAGELAARWDMDVPALVPWRTEAARALLVLGEADRARELLTEQLALVGPGEYLVRAATLRTLAAASAVGERGSLLADAVEAARHCGNPVELALALNDLGRHQLDLGQHGKGRAALRRARQLGDEQGVTLPGRIVPETADNGGGQAAAPTEAGDEHLVGRLSDAEMRVVTLAARGHSNRQIAAKLFVTVSTVEQHLTRVYRKLGIKRRSDLALVLQGGGTVARQGPSVGRETATTAEAGAGALQEAEYGPIGTRVRYGEAGRESRLLVPIRRA
ncbi:LuxR family transcriptional regulator [Streptomyces sp. HPF1205]|uniref:helix-turn-helix transcriptional regulator n=1 Tax=Streptomyces sp. HPF1205 TaxID=2873262 RepID=UPI001CECF299|nr:LuxR family transcriptional regulator [Streptomyces sp. HPF1205]